MAYMYLAAAILFEVLGTIAMKYSEGFTKVIPSAATVVFHGVCFVSLTFALKSLPVSSVYPIWAGVGTALMALMGLFFFNEPLPLQKVVATSLIILGVVILTVGEEKGAVVKKVAQVEGAVEAPVEPNSSSPAAAARNAG